MNTLLLISAPIVVGAIAFCVLHWWVKPSVPALLQARVVSSYALFLFALALLGTEIAGVVHGASWTRALLPLGLVVLLALWNPPWRMPKTQ
jgi:hypothetical protein